MKTIIITRAINEGYPKEYKEILERSNINKIAVNKVDVKSNVRIFLDCHHWKDYLHFEEQLITRGTNEIPKKYRDRFLFFKQVKKPCTECGKELFCFPSSLGSAIDLAYKLGTKELLLVADNNIIEDNIYFYNGFMEQTKKIVYFYKTKMNIYQFSNGNLNILVKTIEEFVK